VETTSDKPATNYEPTNLIEFRGIANNPPGPRTVVAFGPIAYSREAEVATGKLVWACAIYVIVHSERIRINNQRLDNGE
jgi:hypothetical protein